MAPVRGYRTRRETRTPPALTAPKAVIPICRTPTVSTLDYVPRPRQGLDPGWKLCHSDGGMSSTRLVRLARMYAAHRGITLSTAGRLLANHGAFFTRLLSGHTVTEVRAERVAGAISHRWPVDLAWPADIPRPAPESYSPRGTDWRKRRAARDAVDKGTCTGRETGGQKEDSAPTSTSC